MGTPGGEAWLEPTSAGRTLTTEWGTVSSDVETLVVHLAAGEDPADVVFPFTATAFVTLPALVEDIVSIDGADLVADPLGLPLPSGLVMLSDGVWLVERTDHTHLAARVSFSAQTLSFVDETTQGAAVDWSFLVVRGDEARAREVRDRFVNEVFPKVVVTAPVEPKERY